MQLSKILLAIPTVFTLVSAAASPNAIPLALAQPYALASPEEEWDFTPEQLKCVEQKCDLFTNRIVECAEKNELNTQEDGMEYAKCICTGDFKSTFHPCLDCYTGASKTSLKSQYVSLCKSIGINLEGSASKGLCGSGWVGIAAAGAAVVGGMAL